MSEYTVVNRFNSCGEAWVSVKLKDRGIYVMPEREYNRIIETEKKNWKYRVA